MSWTGPVAGTAPFPPAYPGGQPIHAQQQGYQYRQPPLPTAYSSANGTQRLPDVRPPKKKGNPIITRYPPPPGYRPPPQPPAPFAGGQYAHPHSASQYSHVHQPHTPSFLSHSPQEYSHPIYGHSQPLSYPLQPYSSHQSHTWPQSIYPPAQSHAQPPIAIPNFHPIPNSHGGHSSHSIAAGYSHPVPHQTSAWPMSHQEPPYTSAEHKFFHHPQATSTASMQSHGMALPQNVSHPDPLGSQLTQPTVATAPEAVSSGTSQLISAWDDWDFDFDGAIWPKSNELVDPHLSLGVIVWHPAKQMTRALPSTFAEAEEQALWPTPEKLGNGESVSVYFMAENSHEAFLDVRQTDQWALICDDPIFVMFTDQQLRDDLVSLEDCIAQRDRPDDATDYQHNRDQEMHDTNWNVMDNLEQALTGNVKISNSPLPSNDGVPLQTASQEDVLARLGVTGHAKPHLDEVLTAPPLESCDKLLTSRRGKPEIDSCSGASQPALPRAQIKTHYGQGSKHTNNSDKHTFGIMSPLAAFVPLPSAPPPPSNHGNSHSVHSSLVGFDPPQQSPVAPEGSSRTMAGFDVDNKITAQSSAAETSPVAVPSLDRNDSSFTRKRNYEVDEQDEQLSLLQDDHSKRKRRSQVDAVYSRR